MALHDRLTMAGKEFTISAAGTVADIRRHMIAIAAREHAAVMAAEPRPTRFLRYVDGVAGAPIEGVQLGGLIVTDYPRLDLVAAFARETLRDLSPIKEGTYRDAHQFYLNGIAVDHVRDYRSGDEIVIANAVPYSRKIELGRMKMRVPGTDRVYQRALLIVREQYRDVARVRFTWRGIEAGDLAVGKRGDKSELRYPALVIAER